MPCGGIFPAKDSGTCLLCGQDGSDHFCVEWDAGLHALCIPEFLADSVEGHVVMAHKHTVIIDQGEEDETEDTVVRSIENND